MSVPGPYERDSFHPPALFTYQMKINFCIYAKLFQLSLPYGIYVLSWNDLRFTICDLRMRFSRNPYFTFQIYLDSLVIIRASDDWNF